jgi:hypothetical protein
VTGDGQNALRVTNPYCRIAEPYRTDFRGLATYIVPKVDVQVAATWTSIPGDSLAANFVATNAWIAAGPQPLGRNLSGAANVTVNLIPPHTFYTRVFRRKAEAALGPRFDVRTVNQYKSELKRATLGGPIKRHQVRYSIGRSRPFGASACIRGSAPSSGWRRVT